MKRRTLNLRGGAALRGPSFNKRPYNEDTTTASNALYLSSDPPFLVVLGSRLRLSFFFLCRCSLEVIVPAANNSSFS